MLRMMDKDLVLDLFKNIDADFQINMHPYVDTHWVKFFDHLTSAGTLPLQGDIKYKVDRNIVNIFDITILIQTDTLNCYKITFKNNTLQEWNIENISNQEYNEV